MLDRYLIPRLRPLLRRTAIGLDRAGVRADHLTLAGFAAGLMAVLALAAGMPMLALVGLALNRLADGLDGELARQQSPTDAGAFLDITLDFLFYALFPLGFALWDPSQNALPAAVLVTSFIGTGASFLAFASFAEKRAIEHPEFHYKGLYYLDGLCEGTETIACFVLMSVFPQWFPQVAYGFALLCFIAAVNRVVSGYRSLR